jgi:hypothetical protein
MIFLIRNKIKKFQNNYKLKKFKIKALKHLWRMWSCSFKQTRLQCKRTWVGFYPGPDSFIESLISLLPDNRLKKTLSLICKIVMSS